MQTSNMNDMPDANDMPDVLEEALSTIIAQERREWNREHDLALAKRDALIADLRREATEVRLELKRVVEDFVFCAEVTIAKAIENIRDGKDGAPGEQGIQGEPGMNGKDGIDGKDGRDGVDGKDGKDGEQGIQGIPGIPGEPGPPGQDGKDGANGKDGLDGIAGRDGIDGTNGRDGIDGQGGKDGAPGKDGIQGIPGEAGKDGLPGVPGKDGLPGKDGRDGIGLAGAFIDRDGNLVITLTGGEIVKLGVVVGKDGSDGEPGLPGKDGFSFDDIDIGFDGERGVMLTFVRNGVRVGKKIDFPVVIYRGVYKEDTEYVRGDTVTWAGSLYHCNETTKEKPGAGSSAWTLAVKRGADGRDRKVE